MAAPLEPNPHAIGTWVDLPDRPGAYELQSVYTKNGESIGNFRDAADQHAEIPLVQLQDAHPELFK